MRAKRKKHFVVWRTYGEAVRCGGGVRCVLGWVWFGLVGEALLGSGSVARPLSDDVGTVIPRDGENSSLEVHNEDLNSCIFGLRFLL